MYKLLLISFLFVSCGQTQNETVSIQTEKTNSSIEVNTINQPELNRQKPIVEKLKSDILRDGDYNRFFYLKLKNNSKFDIVGLTLHIQPSTNSTQSDEGCFLEIQKKIRIKSNETIEIKEKDNREEKKPCFFDSTSVSLSDIVLSNGKLLNFLEFYNADKDLYRK